MPKTAHAGRGDSRVAPFKVGDRVRLNAAGRSAFLPNDWVGTVASVFAEPRSESGWIVSLHRDSGPLTTWSTHWLEAAP